MSNLPWGMVSGFGMIVVACFTCATAGYAEHVRVRPIVVWSGGDSGIKAATSLRITEREQWIKFKEKHLRPEASSASINIDFDRFMLVAVVVPDLPIGRGIYPTSLEADGSKLKVTYSFCLPNRELPQVEMYTSHYFMILLPKSLGELVIEPQSREVQKNQLEPIHFRIKEGQSEGPAERRTRQPG